MSVIRQNNVIGQMRPDASFFRSFDSSVAGDFDLLAGKMLAGKAPLVITGFRINSQGAVLANQLSLQVAGSSAIHFNASVTGSIFNVPDNRPEEVLSSTNPRVIGTFVPNQICYVGLDFIRQADPTTSDVVMFLPDASNAAETPEEVPLGLTVDYRIVISTVDFSATPGICPIARVKTDGSNAIVTLSDARNSFFRLGSGGTNPNAQNAYSWPAGRNEGDSGDPFTGADKSIGSLKTCIDALMTRLWEIGGGEYWYSPTADRNVRLVHTGSPFVSTGEHFEFPSSNLHWQGLRILFDNSSAYFNDIADVTSNVTGLTDLADGECLYVDLDRTANRTGGTALNAKKGVTNTLGVGSPPGSRTIVAWRSGSSIFTRDQGYAVNSSFKLATTVAAGTVRISASDATAYSGGGVIVATVDSTSNQAIAGGLSRGDSGDYAAGAGNIAIGGNDMDQNISLVTTNTLHAIRAVGSQIYGSGGRSTLEILNNSSFGLSDNRIAAFMARNPFLSVIQDAVVIESSGAVGFRNEDSTNFPVASPVPTTASPIRSKFKFKTNGLSSPNTRDQFCVVWYDGTVMILAESAPY